jgi:Uma2 family endonuclease
MGDWGWFEHKRVMLIEGEILEMAGPNPPHSTAVALVLEVLRSIFVSGFVVRGENPLTLGLSTDPVPDAAVVRGSVRDYATNHPTTAELVVDVSESTLNYDTGDKPSLYASAGIADYWVVDLVNRQLVVFRDPQRDSSRPFGFFYADATAYAPGQSASPLRAPQSRVLVNDLLP